MSTILALPTPRLLSGGAAGTAEFATLGRQPEDARLLYLAAALAPDRDRVVPDKKGKAHPYSSVVVRDYLKVWRYAQCIFRKGDGSFPTLVVYAVLVVCETAFEQGQCQRRNRT